MTPTGDELLRDFIPGVDLRIRRGAANVMLEVMDRRLPDPHWSTLEHYPWVQFYPERDSLLQQVRKRLLDQNAPDEVI